MGLHELRQRQQRRGDLQERLPVRGAADGRLFARDRVFHRMQDVLHGYDPCGPELDQTLRRLAREKGQDTVPALGQKGIHRLEKILPQDRLEQVAQGVHPPCVQRIRRRGGHIDDGGKNPGAAQLLRGVDSVFARHHHVQDVQIERLGFVGRLQQAGAGRKGERHERRWIPLLPVLPQQRQNMGEIRVIVITNRQSQHSAAFPRRMLPV